MWFQICSRTGHWNDWALVLCKMPSLQFFYWLLWGSNASSYFIVTYIGSVEKIDLIVSCCGLKLGGFLLKGVLSWFQDLVRDFLFVLGRSNLYSFNLWQLTYLMICEMIYLVEKFTHIDAFKVWTLVILLIRRFNSRIRLCLRGDTLLTTAKILLILI